MCEKFDSFIKKMNMKGWNSHGYLVNEILISMRFLRNDVFSITDTTQYISQ